MMCIPCGLVVRIRRFHRRGRGSIPRMGDSFLTLSPLKPSYDGHSSGHFQKFAVHAVLELYARCRYQPAHAH